MKPSEEFPHYFRDVSHLKTIDVYRIIDLFDVTDPCDQHALKKILAGGKRGAKDTVKDTKEAIVTLRRKLEMLEENQIKEAELLATAHAVRSTSLRTVVGDALADARLDPNEPVGVWDGKTLQPMPAAKETVLYNNKQCLVGPWYEAAGVKPVSSDQVVQVKNYLGHVSGASRANAFGWSNQAGGKFAITHYREVR